MRKSLMFLGLGVSSILTALALVVMFCSPAAADQVSGELRGGFRILSLDGMTESPDLSVYRGDYIKFDTGERTGLVVAIPSLGIETKLTQDLGSAPYFKMKETGVYDFFLGEIKGTITVIEYSQARYKAVTAEQALEVIQTLSPFILDVRTPGEYKSGRLENSSLIPVQLLRQNLSKLYDYKDEPILIYCATGNRSTVASKILIDNGFSRVFNLRYGIKDWQRRNYPLVK